ncbi:MAG: response regulator, partial [Lachnospiraceae bacterium]
CKEKNITFEMLISNIEHELILGDSLRVNQILLNLISNAYKFTPNGGTIKVVLSETGKNGSKVFLRFIVSDTGIGIAPELMERLFLPFEQENAETAQKHGGSGLGLSITKNLVDLMHGAIKVESQKNKGTTFTVDLPFEMVELKEVLEPEEIKNIKTLVVDDDKDTREYTEIVLNRIGVDFEMVSSGEEAVERLTQAFKAGHKYDLCLVDWKMPGLNGIDVTRRIRELFNKETVVIMISAYDLSEVEEEAKEAGADLFVTKPLFQSTIFNVLSSLCGGNFRKKTVHMGEYDFSGHRVLLAEDNELNTEIAVELLNMVQMEVDTAQNGEEAVAKFTHSQLGTYDAILMDIQMPIMDGHEAARMIRKATHPQSDTIPILAMTANAFTEDVTSALSSGMNGHIAKPIDTAILYETLKKYIG